MNIQKIIFYYNLFFCVGCIVSSIFLVDRKILASAREKWQIFISVIYFIWALLAVLETFLLPDKLFFWAAIVSILSFNNVSKLKKFDEEKEFDELAISIIGKKAYKKYKKSIFSAKFKKMTAEEKVDYLKELIGTEEYEKLLKFFEKKYN